jgi:DNA-binding GntR family transcriptional regulator
MNHKPTDDEQLSASEIAYRTIQNAIVTGQLEQGSILTELELVDMIGVSRTPIREAINRLANDGFVNIGRGKKNRKSFVAQFTREDLLELSELRADIEAFTARRAAKVITASEISKLEEIQDRIEAEIDANRDDLLQVFGKLNEEFHRIIWDLGSRRAARLLSGTLSAPVQSAQPSAEQTVPHLRRASTYHRAIIAALRRGDSEGAAIQMSAHIYSIIDRV